ncbi:unnamed protein product [Brachionus calyciflorus]|uniref:C2H2-type domain-containing protein n=1 Tax=Brachionus calyciflorus TaxID=104777 RepID=A0A813MBE0_9BILA|nr:unnamed protein product [Brachionus calyciflorus]
MEIENIVEVNLKENHGKMLPSSSSSASHLCKDCFRTFKDINNYKEHRFQEHHITEYPNIRKCSMCSYATLLKSKYDCHMRCHLNNKVIKCNRCDYSTINIRHMSRHERMHMVTSSDKIKTKTSAFHSFGKKKYLKKALESTEKSKSQEEKFQNINFEMIKNIITQHLEKQKSEQELLDTGSHSNIITPPTSVQSDSNSPQKYTPISPPPPTALQHRVYTQEQQEYFYPMYQPPLPLFPFYQKFSNIPNYEQMPHFHDSTGFCRYTTELEFLRKNVYKLLAYLMPHIVQMFNIDINSVEKSQQIDKLIDYLLINNNNNNNQINNETLGNRMI